MFNDNDEKNRYVYEIWNTLEARYLRVYPFLTDGEFRDLFGETVVRILESLNCKNEACGKCDFEIDCPYYSKMLDRCGIHLYKPVHCRLWHCYDCGPKHIIKEIRDLTGIFSDQLGPEEAGERIKQALESGQISKEEAEKRFLELIEGFRNGD